MQLHNYKPITFKWVLFIAAWLLLFLFFSLPSRSNTSKLANTTEKQQIAQP